MQTNTEEPLIPQTKQGGTFASHCPYIFPRWTLLRIQMDIHTEYICIYVLYLGRPHLSCRCTHFNQTEVGTTRYICGGY